MPENAQDVLWNDLCGMDFEDVCRRSLASFDSRSGGYILRVLNEDYLIIPRLKRIEKIEKDGSKTEMKSFFYRLAVLAYLANAEEAELRGRLVSLTQIKGGIFFEVPVHDLRINPLIEKFGDNPDDFLKAGLLLGGERRGYGDSSFELRIFPRIPITYVLWVADEEFPAKISIYMDASVEFQMPPDALWTAIVMTSEKLSEIRV